MSPLWRDELRVGLCPDRLVVARRRHREIVPTAGDPLAALKAIAGTAALTVVLSSHFVRYAVLPPSDALKSDQDWLAYAHHSFASTYGNESARWQIRLCATGPRQARIACAVDGELLEGLGEMPQLKSIQPYLMLAFNARRRALAAASAWVVLHERGRLTVALINDGIWQTIRVRRIGDDWQESLADVLDREAAIAGVAGCEQVVLCAEEQAPARLGRYRILDLSVPAGAGHELRAYVMTLH